MKKLQEILKRIIAYSDAIDKASDTEEAALNSKILLGALLGVDLVIFQALLSISPVDSAVETSLSTLSVAILVSAAFLYIRHVQEKQNIHGYPVKFVKLLAYAGMGTTFTGVYYAIVHVSLHAANIFALTCMFLAILILIINQKVLGKDQPKDTPKQKEKEPP